MHPSFSDNQSNGNWLVAMIENFLVPILAVAATVLCILLVIFVGYLIWGEISGRF